VYCWIWCSALGVVAEVLRSRCVVLCTVCKFISCIYNARTHIHQIALNVRYRINKSFQLDYMPKHRNPTNSRIPLKSILKLYSNILLVLPSGLFLSGITRYKLRSSFMFHFVNRHIYPSSQLVNSAHPTCSKCSPYALFLLERKSRFSVGKKSTYCGAST
jgi:hypothetical protein